MMAAHIRFAAFFVSALGTLGWAVPTPAVASFHPPQTDRYGDPLPSGALMRLGMVTP